MNTFFKALLLSGIVLLGACSTTHVTEHQQAETIHALLFTPDKMYLLGENADYEFPHIAPKKEQYPHTTSQFRTFLASPAVKQIANHDLKIRVVDNTQVVLHYHANFSPLLNDEQIHVLRQNGIKIISSRRPSGESEKQWTAFSAKGKLVRLQNRAALSNQHFLSRPLNIQVQYTRKQLAFDKYRAGEIGGVLLAPVLIPATMMIWGVSCLGSHNTGC